MRHIILLVFTILGLGLSGQDCNNINYNGDFELRNHIPGISNILGISAGEIENWYSSHGTADFLDETWNWYGLNNITSNLGHICYGIREQGVHSEGFFTKLEILSDTDLSYDISFDYGNICEENKTGIVYVYLANNIVGGSNFSAFNMPTEQTKPQWFANAKKMETIYLTEQTDYQLNGLTHFSKEISVDERYSQLWFFTDYKGSYEGLLNCGFLLDNLNVKCTTNALAGIKAVPNNQRNWKFEAILESNINITQYNWDFGDGNSSNVEKPTHNFEEGSYTICLDIMDDRNACARSCTTLELKSPGGSETCDYSVCLDASGVPAINDILVYDESGDPIHLNEIQEFNFPYCIASWSSCTEQAFQLDGLIEDINFWLEKNNFTGKANKNTDSSMADGCRMNILNIQNVDLTFSSLEIIDEANHYTHIEYMFSPGNCIAAENKDQEQETIQLQTNKTEIKIYPQPAHTQIRVVSDSDNKIQEIDLFDSTGNLLRMYKECLPEGRDIDVSELQSGAYYLSVFDGREWQTQRFIKI